MSLLRGRRLVMIAALCALMVVSVGCSSVGKYARHRAEDALEMIDLGFTFTAKPCIGLYWNSLDVFPVGYSYIDGYFLGWGGGQLGVTRHYNHCWGFGYAREEIGWGEFDKDDPDTLYIDYSGVLGFVLPPYENEPAYTPACVHFIPHILFVGFVWNARWYEIADFFVGFTTLDIAGDDGEKMGHWPWQSRHNGPVFGGEEM